jgi:hypothetical protein
MFVPSPLLPNGDMMDQTQTTLSPQSAGILPTHFLSVGSFSASRTNQ